MPKSYEMSLIVGAALTSSFSSSFNAANREVMKMQNQLRDFNKIQSDISSYQRQQSAVEASKTKLSALQQQYANIQRELQETGNSSSALQNKLIDKEQQINKASAAVDNQNAKLNEMSAALRNAGVSTDDLAGGTRRLESDIKELAQHQEAAAQKADKFAQAEARVAQAVQMQAAVAPIGEAIKAFAGYMSECGDASMEFESALTGVAKTTDLTDAELKAISSEIKALATEDIPVMATELLGVAEAAGQLGIAKEYILDFTEVMTNLGATTNLTSGDAATQLAKFANITKMAATDYERLGSTIVALGNNSATTEADIVNMGMRLASAGKQAGMTEAEIMSMSAALSSLGLEAQAGGSSFSKVISQMQIAVETGSDALKDYAEVAGMSAKDFAVAFGTDAAGALSAFVTGLSDTQRLGASATVMLDEMGITELRMSDALKRAASSGDLFNETLALGNQAWAENAALQKEAATRYATTESQLTLMQNAYKNVQVSIGDALAPVMRELYAIGVELLNGIAQFISANPGLVKAIVAFAAVIGVAVIAITAYAAYVKIAAAANTLFASTVPGLNIIMAVVGGIAALAAAVAAFSGENEKAVPNVRELTTAARELSDTIKDSSNTYDDTVAATLAASNVAGTYISRLEALEAAGITTDSQAREYHNTLALLSEVMPELAGQIDLETNSIEGGTAALRANTEAWKENAIQQAAQDQLTALYKEHAAVLIEAEENSIRLTEAKKEAERAEQAQGDAIERMNVLMAEAQKEADALNRATGSLATAGDILQANQEYQALYASLGGLAEEASRAKQTEDAYTDAITKGNKASEEAEKIIADKEKAIKNLVGVTSEENLAAKESVQIQAELQAVITGVTDQIAELAEAYDKSYDAALSSVEGQYSLWDKAEKVTATSVKSMNATIESQTKYWQDYNANLEGLGARADDIDGLREMMASFSDGSKESVNAIAGFAKASDEDLQKAAANFKQLQEAQGATADSLAEVQTDFTNATNAIVQDLTDKVGEMNLSAEAAEAGKSTVQGFINSAKDMLPKVTEAYKSVGDTAIKAMQSALKVASPSKIALWLGEMTVGAFNLGGEKEKKKTKSTYEQVADTAIEALTPEESKKRKKRPKANDEDEGFEFGGMGGLAFAGGSGAVVFHLQPHYHLGGSMDGNLEDQLQQHDSSLIERIKEILRDLDDDDKRTRY